MITVTAKQKRALGITTIAALVLGAFFFKHYLLLIATAAIVAFAFNPIYQYFLKRFKSPNKAASTTLIVTIFAILIPLALVITITAYQIASFADAIATSGQNTDLTKLISALITHTNQLLHSAGISYQVSQEALRQELAKNLAAHGQDFLKAIAGFIGSAGQFITDFIIYIYVFISLLINQDKIIDLLYRLNPLGKQTGDLYVQRTGVMTKGIIRGQFVIALIQGFTDAALLYLAGFHSAFFFFFFILTILSIIPLGGGIIVLPIGVVMILTGHIWQGLLLILGHILIVTNEDNILRPKLVPRQARLDPALLLLSVFSGIAFFGFLGIVLGPIIMVLIVTTIQVFLEVYRNVEAVDRRPADTSPGLGTKIKRLFTRKA